VTDVASTRITTDAETAASAPEFFRVSQLVPLDQDVVTVPIGTRVGEALDLMRDHAFDQLPVITVDDRVVGAFTYRSFARELRHVRAQDDPRSVPVDDLVEDLKFVRPSDEVGAILGAIEADNAVLVGDEDRLLAVVTTADVTRFLWRRTRPFVLLQDIELAIRDLMRSACSAEQLVGCVIAVLLGETDQVDRRLEDLTLGDLLSVLLHGASFGKFFRLRFGPNRDLVRTMLEPVRDIRNKVFHFRDDVSEDELLNLLRVAAWLRRKVLIRGEAR
jgi:predicted transcriptional regulator